MSEFFVQAPTYMMYGLGLVYASAFISHCMSKLTRRK